MPQPYIGEIRQFAGTFGPDGWLICNGALLPIDENETLFQLIGTTYGGDGQSTFAIPDLRGRVPVHQGAGFQLAQTGGTETITLTLQQIPSHTHNAMAASAGTSDIADGKVWAESRSTKQYVAGPATMPMNSAAMANTGGSQPHENMVPYTAVNFIISLFGVFPPQTGGAASNDAYLSQVDIFSFVFPPKGYAACNGQTLPIAQNQALFSLLGTTYGGNGQTTFALPNLQGKTPMDDGSSGPFDFMALGQTGGAATHTISLNELPAHGHGGNAGSIPNNSSPAGNFFASGTGATAFADSPDVAMASGTMTNVGGGQAHNNMSPYLVLNMCICISGSFPSPN